MHAICTTASSSCYTTYRGGVRPVAGLPQPLRSRSFARSLATPIRATADLPTVPSDRFRRVNRVVFDFAAWTRHRSSDRYANNVLSIPNSRILTHLTSPLLWLAGFSTVFCLYEQARDNGQLEGFPSMNLASPEPQVLTSFALSLLLVFRTNSSYARFDEARKIWGSVLNRCRNLVQQVVSNFPDDDPVTKDAVGRWTIAFARSLQGHLQEETDLRKELTGVLMPEELEMLLKAPHRPIKTLSVISELVHATPVDPWRKQMVQADITSFFDNLGACERILKTPIPLSYTRHTCRFLLIWLTALPLGLWTHVHWTLVPITLMIALLLLGIEEIGVQIEEPFGILPLDKICERAAIDINDLLREGGDMKAFVHRLRGTGSNTSVDSEVLAQLAEMHSKADLQLAASLMRPSGAGRNGSQ